MYKDKYGGRFMNLTTLAAAQAAVEEGLSLAEKFTTSAMVILTGFAIVFAVLILLIIIIKIYSTIVYNAQNRSKKKEENLQQVSVPEPTVVQPITKNEPATNDGIPEEIIAVISAAVATMYGPKEKVRIKSIKKSSGGRSAWANAGILDNTRPF